LAQSVNGVVVRRLSNKAGFAGEGRIARASSTTSKGWFVSICTLLLGAAIVASLIYYNAQPYSLWSAGPVRNQRTWEEYLVVNSSTLLFLPWLLIFGLLRERADNFGFRLPEPGASRLALLFYLLMLPLLWLAARFPAFQNYYPLQPQAAYSWNALLFHELSYGFYLFCWEFFYRGFLTFGLGRAFGFPLAIGLQAVAFGIMHGGKPLPEFYGSFVAGIALGMLAVRGRSFLPCFAVHWAVSVTFDLLVMRFKPGSLLNI